MSIPDPWPRGQPLSEHVITGNARENRMNQPWRAAVAAVEIVLAGGLLFAAWWTWGRGVFPVEFPVAGGEPGQATRTIGSWLTMSVASATVAGLSLLDASRQLLLALDTGRWRKARRRPEPDARPG